jgi:hypothetical protein
MTSADRPAAAWSAAFASAPGSAMNVYADVMVPRIFEPWGRELLGVDSRHRGLVAFSIQPTTASGATSLSSASSSRNSSQASDSTSALPMA